MPIPCPQCNSDETKIIDSRPAHGGTRRRLLCPECGRRFTTAEVIADADCTGWARGTTILTALAKRYGDEERLQAFTSEELLQELIKRQREAS